MTFDAEQQMADLQVAKRVLLAMSLDGRSERTLADCEAVIERGLTSFVEVGEALLTIRDGRLYRESHKTFEDYCRERWGWARAHAYRLVESAEVMGALSPMGDIQPPTNERQARELAPLRDQPEEMAAAWREVVEETDGKPTALAIREKVDEHLNRANDGAPAIAVRAYRAVVGFAELGSLSPKAVAAYLETNHRSLTLAGARRGHQWLGELIVELERLEPGARRREA